ncbi:MAG TPA: hypothetical protein DER02_05095 [Gammaproteobacteria bacterium]|nr:hypothetical protein [Gammaproteobacteria bacterium]|tara:strand:+ start:4861 stop:5682 length:822 start_codon:yes stop_codon:yes gene_type:complete
MKVEVYGGHHSPWVQAVLLGLREKGIDHSLRALPPYATFKKWGLLMPAVSIDNQDWQVESSDILANIGFDPISEEDLAAIRMAWQGVLHRPDNPPRFFAGFSRAGDKSKSLFKRSCVNFIRGFIPAYMFTLINTVKFTQKPKDPENFGDQFLYWEGALQASSGPFVDGEKPGIRDMLLFGLVQCHSSIPVPPLKALRQDPRLQSLRHWIGVMQERYDGYPLMFSANYFQPEVAAPEPADGLQRSFFYAGLLGTVLAMPLTLPLMFFLMRKVPR